MNPYSPAWHTVCVYECLYGGTVGAGTVYFACACTNTIMLCSHAYIITPLNVEVMHPGDINAHAVMTHHWNVVHAVGKIWLGVIKAKARSG